MTNKKLLAGVTLALLSVAVPAHQDSESPALQDEVISRIDAMCPDAMREMEEIQSRRKVPRVSAQVSRPALRENLLLMARQDQEARAFLLSSGWPLDPGNPQVQWLNQVDSRNRARLKHIVNQDGFPTAEQVGLDGVEAAWLMTIHAGSDPDFQERVLSLTTRHVQRGEVGSDQVAMLTDDLLAGRGKPQRYGSNFEMRDGAWRPTPIEDEANVDERRKSVGLGSLENYACFIRAMYGSSGSPQAPGPAASNE